MPAQPRQIVPSDQFEEMCGAGLLRRIPIASGDFAGSVAWHQTVVGELQGFRKARARRRSTNLCRHRHAGRFGDRAFTLKNRLRITMNDLNLNFRFFLEIEMRFALKSIVLSAMIFYPFSSALAFGPDEPLYPINTNGCVVPSNARVVRTVHGTHKACSRDEAYEQAERDAFNYARKVSPQTCSNLAAEERIAICRQYGLVPAVLHDPKQLAFVQPSHLTPLVATRKACAAVDMRHERAEISESPNDDWFCGTLYRYRVYIDMRCGVCCKPAE